MGRLALSGFQLSFIRPEMEYNGFRVVKGDNGVAEVVFARPEKLNTITPEICATLSSIVQELDGDDKVRVILLWAEGRMFTAGLDLNQLMPLRSNPKLSRAENSRIFLNNVVPFQASITTLENAKKPVVAVIHGKCIGGGIDLITACDIRLCSADATFVVKETPMAIVADLGTIPRLQKLVGKGVASEMIFTGEDIDAQRALAVGLVNRVEADGAAALAAGRALCARIAANSPLVVAGAKRAMRFAEDHSTADTLEHLALWNTAFLESDDLLEAVAAFMTKRTPRFRSLL